MPAYICKKGCLCVRNFKGLTKDEAFLKYWRQKHPHVTHDEGKLLLSANYRNVKEAFTAGFEAGRK